MRSTAICFTAVLLASSANAQDMSGSYEAAGGAPPGEHVIEAAPAAEAAAAAVRCVNTAWSARDNRNANHVTALGNPFGAALKSLVVYFSTGGDLSIRYPILWSWSVPYSGNPVTVEVTSTRINLHIWAGAPLHGVWDGNSGAWRLFNEGYWMASLCR